MRNLTEMINNPKKCKCGRNPKSEYRGCGVNMIVCSCGLSSDYERWEEGFYDLKIKASGFGYEVNEDGK